MLKDNTKKPHDSTLGCNCRNTKCLKLYCECLRKGKTCSNHCNCSGCENHCESTHRQDKLKALEKKKYPKHNMESTD